LLLFFQRIEKAHAYFVLYDSILFYGFFHIQEVFVPREEYSYLFIA
jgi:hypothetical protein